MSYAHADKSLRGVGREMKKEDADQLIRCVKECWWRVAVLFFLIFGFALIAMYGFPSFELDQIAAAWVQAIGSILALFVSIGVVRHDHRLKRRETTDELKRSLESLINCIATVQSLAASFYKLRVMCVGPELNKTDYAIIFRAWSNTFQNIYLSQPKWSDLGLIAAIMEVNVRLEKLIEIDGDFNEGRLDTESAMKEMNYIFAFLEGAKKKIVRFAADEKILLSCTLKRQKDNRLRVAREHLQAMQLEKPREASQAALKLGDW